MAKSASAPGGPWQKLRAASVRTQLVVFGTILSAAVILLSFGAVSIEIRRQTRALLAETVGRNQGLLLKQQKANLEQLIQISGVITSNPTLRAAIETYRSESGTGIDSVRADLIATIQVEAAKIGAAVGKDALIITDERGMVLAATGRSTALPIVGEDLSSWPAVKQATDPAAKAFGGTNVVELRGHTFQVGCAPIVLQGYLIGTLALGEEMNDGFVKGLEEATDGDVVLVGGGRVLGSTMAPTRSELVAKWPTEAAAGKAAESRVVKVDGEEYVTAALPLGPGVDGKPVTLHLLHSLSRALARPREELLWTLVFHSLIALLLTGIMVWLAASSILRPLDRFVAFLDEVTRTGTYGRRSPQFAGPVEVERLRQTYDHLIDGLMRDFLRMDRLRESEKMAALGRMLSGAAHEINNPLTGVVGQVDLLMGRRDLTDDVRRRLTSVQQDGYRVVGLVRNLLRTSHRDEGVYAPCDLNRLLADAAALRRHDFKGAGLEFLLEKGDGEAIVLANELALQQVFINIIGNALDALREAGGKHTLHVTSKVDGERVTVVFADDGPGLREPDRVFEPFYTTKGVGKGTGLGLSLCAATVRDHGGTIEARNRPQGGAVFTVRLPLAPEERRVLPKSNDTLSGVLLRPAEAAKGRVVLVVDDEPSVLDVQVQIIEHMGAEVLPARNAGEALLELAARPIDLVVSDMKMPGGLSGPDLYRAAQERAAADPSFVMPRFVFVTGDTFANNGIEFLRGENLPYVTKPFSIDEYVTVIQEVLHENMRRAA